MLVRGRPPLTSEPDVGVQVLSPSPAVSLSPKPDSAAQFSRGWPGVPGVGPELPECGSGRLGARAAMVGVGPGQADAVSPSEP